MALVRSFAHTNSGHAGGTHFVMTGYDNKMVDNGGVPSQQAFKAKVAKYETEKAEIKSKAEKLEKARDADREAATEASRHGGGMGSAVSVFQIAIAIGSICLVTKKRSLWYVALALAGVATAMMLKVWLT